MKPGDTIGFAFYSLRGYTARTGLMLLAMSIGVAAVVILTALGESARIYVTSEFAALGTNMVIVLPGRSETSGAGLSVAVSETVRDLTLEDAMALTRSAAVRRIAPLNVGAAPVSWGGREREVPVLGTTAEFLDIRRFRMGQGSFLSPGDISKATAECVIGVKLREELFGTLPALGEWLRIGERRFRVVGILSPIGTSLGMDTEDLIIIPVASAQSLFNTTSLFRIIVEASSREAMPRVKDFVRETIKARHQGEEDVTVITQDAVLATFDRIFRALTLAVAGIAAISLAVAGILIMNVMLVAVTQRTAEIGLLKAIGATPRHILLLFLTEACLLSAAGAVTGLALGAGGNWIIGNLYPTLTVSAPLWAVASAVSVAMLTGLFFGILPARRAARLDPVQSLSRR